MQNNIQLQPNPAIVSYLEHFQVAQVNLSLFLMEEKNARKRRRFKPQPRKMASKIHHGD